MTTQAQNKLTANPAKAVSALTVGGVSYPAAMSLIGNLIQSWNISWLETTQAHHWLGAIVAGVMAAIAGWRTSNEPGKLAQKKQQKFDQKVADALERQQAGE